MAKKEYEASLEHGQPITLIAFGYARNFSGANGFFYTDAASDRRLYLHSLDRSLTSVSTYQSVQMKISERDETQGLDNAALTIEIDSQAAIVDFIMDSNPLLSPVEARIYEGHSVDGRVTAENFSRTFIGIVSGATRKSDGWAQITVDPAGVALLRGGLRRSYQRYCPHALYGDACKARTNHIVASATARAVGRNFIEVDADWTDSIQANESAYAGATDRLAAIRDHYGASIKDAYINGIASWTANSILQRQSIFDIKEGEGEGGRDVIVLKTGARGLQAGGRVEFIFGCARDFSQCRNLHGNIANFGGFVHIPSRNPVANLNHSFY